MTPLLKGTNTVKKSLPALAAILMSVAACAPTYDQFGNPVRTSGSFAPAVGAIGGGAVSGLACSNLGKGNGKVAITAACTLAGGIIGLFAGQSYQNANAAYAAQAQNQALNAPVGAPIPWTNPENGAHGTVTTTRQGRDSSTGAYCREYQHRVTIDGKLQKGFGRACQQPDGSWEIIG